MAKLSLFYPVKPNIINQGFGGNGDYYRDNGINIVGHNGIDFHAIHGQPIYAAHDGICYPEIDSTGGNGVVLLTKEQFDYNGGQCYFKTIYWHMIKDDAVVNTNQVVKAGALIGYADSTGLSTGDHLHFGLKPVVPGEAAFAWVTLNPNNGYLGAIDPIPYFSGQFAEDINLPIPTEPFNKSLSLGQSNNEVKRLQNTLRRMGYFTYPTDTGFYGSVTQAAVLQFQYHNNIVTFGVESGFGAFFGPKSRAVLNKLLSGQLAGS